MLTHKIRLIPLYLALATLLVSCGNKNDTKADKEVRIAANLPLTEALATYGTAVREGASMAVEELAKKGSSVSQRYDWQDNKSDANIAQNVMKQQYFGRVDIYVSGVKPQYMAIKDAIAARGTPNFVWVFDAYINAGSPVQNNFRTWVSYKLEPPLYISYANQVRAKRVAITYVQLPHTIEEFEKLVIPGLKKEGISDVFVQPFQFGTEPFPDIAVKIKEYNPDLIILNGFQGDLVALVRECRRLGLVKDGNTLATYDMLDAAKLLGPDELEGIRVIVPVFETRAEQQNIKEWRQRFRAKFGKEPLYTHAFAYDMATIIDDAGNRLKLPSNSGEWIKALRETDTAGITGRLKFDQDGDLVTPLEVGVYRKGTLTPDSRGK